MVPCVVYDPAVTHLNTDCEGFTWQERINTCTIIYHAPSVTGDRPKYKFFMTEISFRKVNKYKSLGSQLLFFCELAELAAGTKKKL